VPPEGRSGQTPDALFCCDSSAAITALLAYSLSAVFSNNSNQKKQLRQWRLSAFAAQ